MDTLKSLLPKPAIVESGDGSSDVVTHQTNALDAKRLAKQAAKHLFNDAIRFIEAEHSWAYPEDDLNAHLDKNFPGHIKFLVEVFTDELNEELKRLYNDRRAV